MKNGLFNIRTKSANLRKTENWTDLNNLKTNKAADPKGLISEIFKPDVVGAALIQSLLVLWMNAKSQVLLNGQIFQVSIKIED